ncbi:MAG: enoyl-CoA hydratase/isomerase family protein, partial [Leptonema sp. (in: Bacteria)]|nr:enoyl-CoA hydratase/isomerase family protein [Leptonema sp. (in: bacteria)]
MSYKYILLTEDQGVHTVTFNRPDLRNAFNDEMISEITDAFQNQISTESSRAVVIRGAGSAFCAGGDMNWMRRMKNATHQENVDDALRLDKMFDSIYRCNRPVISVVHGAVVGGGTGVLAASDIVIAYVEAKFGFTEAKIGISPAVISTYLMQKINAAQLRHFALTAELFSATDAYHAGLVNRVENTLESLEECLERILDSIFLTGPNAVARTKQLLRYQFEHSFEDRRREAASVIADLRVS